MAEHKKSFIAYADWKETFDSLPDEKAGQLIKHIFAYVNDDNPISDDILINAVFINIRNTLKRDLKKWETQYNQRVEAGKRSAEVRKRNAAVVNERSISSTVSVSDSVSDSVTEKKNIKAIPTYIEFKDYAVKNQFNTDLHKLELKYKSWVASDWNDGNGKKIKNWKSKILNTLPYLVDLNVKDPSKKTTKLSI